MELNNLVRSQNASARRKPLYWNKLRNLRSQIIKLLFRQPSVRERYSNK
uniref:Uncharacterized protein n=1 Tax=Timema poppense TaxID=170557 RepID=A0A7R9DTA0_TIMPO|nr:unnamed protein product [Timema poppensis]